MKYRGVFLADGHDGNRALRQASAKAGRLVEEYNAYIGEEDIYNSYGERLSEPWQIIRQDRANYHRFGTSQPGDEGDSFLCLGRGTAKRPSA